MPKKPTNAAELARKAGDLKKALRKIDELAGVESGTWIAANQNDVAKFFGVSLNTVIAWGKREMPGKKGFWPLDKIAQWLHKDGPWKPRLSAEEDTAVDSPALERSRLARAKLLEYELAERQEHILPVDVMRDELLRLAAPLKRANDRLSQLFGHRAAEIVDDALAEFQRGIDERWSE